MNKNLLLAALAIATAFSALRADVTFDPSTGTGFIGRGDVLSSLGKPALVERPTIVFISGRSATFEVTWEWTSTAGKEQETKLHSNTQRIEVLGASLVTSSTRTASGKTATHINGYLLNSLHSLTSGETLPAVGDTRAGSDGLKKTCVSVKLVSEAGLTTEGVGELWFYTDSSMSYGTRLPFTIPQDASLNGDI